MYGGHRNGFESLRMSGTKKRTIFQTIAIECVRIPFDYMAAPDVLFNISPRSVACVTICGNLLTHSTFFWLTFSEC